MTFEEWFANEAPFSLDRRSDGKYDSHTTYWSDRAWNAALEEAAKRCDRRQKSLVGQARPEEARTVGMLAEDFRALARPVQTEER